MTSEAQTLIFELDAALSKASDSHHLTILRRVTDLFLDGSKAFSDDQVAIFDDVIGRLIEKTDHPALIELSARLAPLGNAPLNVIAHLSGNDDFAVAGPILEKSNLLTNEILAEIVGTKSQKHLAAIAGRPQLSETVTDCLIDRGSPEVAYKLTGNPGARLSELGFVKLIGRAKSDKALAVAISNRTDMPPELEPFLRLALA